MPNAQEVVGVEEISPEEFFEKLSEQLRIEGELDQELVEILVTNILTCSPKDNAVEVVVGKIDLLAESRAIASLGPKSEAINDD